MSSEARDRVIDAFAAVEGRGAGELRANARAADEKGGLAVRLDHDNRAVASRWLLSLRLSFQLLSRCAIEFKWLL